MYLRDCYEINSMKKKSVQTAVKQQQKSVRH